MMNTLSWLLYAADVVPKIGVLFIVAAVISGGGIVAGILIGASMRESTSYSSGRDKPERWDQGVALQKKSLKYIWVSVLCVAFSVVIPSQQTIYMIAASEMGETVVANPEAQEIFDAMKAKVKEFLAVEEKN